ncbi:DUF7691 family protein [Streptomyces xanthochromogenes]|uniref:DUF7691 family protein n=1 Tax=Streptomyces xanthochromogenes TaxID=67384 RepID=UPI001674BC9A|nr:hypothetical protein [Streptomyces xanthochromogenes]
MSKIVNFTMVNPGKVKRFLPAQDLSAEETRLLGLMREAARERQEDLDYQEVDWELSVQDALEHLLAGRADSTADYAGSAYYAALQIIIEHNAGDWETLGSYHSPYTLFSALDKALSTAGVSKELLPSQYVYSGPSVSFYVPSPLEGSPEIGIWPLSGVGQAVEAYRAAADQVDTDLRYDLDELITALDTWASEWSEGRGEWWWAEDGAIFFSIVG